MCLPVEIIGISVVPTPAAVAPLLVAVITDERAELGFEMLNFILVCVWLVRKHIVAEEVAQTVDAYVEPN